MANVYTGNNIFKKEESKITVFLKREVIVVKFVKIIEYIRRYDIKKPLSDTP